MAFGDLLDTKSNTSTNPGTSIAFSAAMTVAVGDLVVVGVAVRGGPSTESLADDLLNVWTVLTTDTGTQQIRTYWSIITNAGSMTVTFTMASTTGDTVIIGARFEGPFAASPLDVNPASTTDTTTPFDCPATGTLSQADELIVTFLGGGNGKTDILASSPLTLALNVASGTGANTECGAMGYKVVSSTSTTTPQFTAVSGNFSSSARQNLASFKKAVATNVILGQILL